ncbi:MAG: LemA family [Pseudomonadota bacterium]|nr:LemA family [Pseudomonadota bacterium]
MKNLIKKLSLQGKTSVSVLIILVLLGFFGAYLIFAYGVLRNEIRTINVAWTELRVLNKHETELAHNLIDVVKSSAFESNNTFESSNFEHIVIDDVTDAQYRCSVIELTDDLIDNQHDFSQYQQSYAILEVALDALLVSIKQYSSLQESSLQESSLQESSLQESSVQDSSVQAHSLVTQQHVAQQQIAQQQNLLNQIKLNRQQLLAARENYNSLVLAYNNGIEIFPQNILVRIFRLSPKAYFVANDALLQF